MKRIVSVLLGSMFAVVGMSAAANAYPPDGVVLSASATQLNPGEPFTLTLTGCAPGEVVVFEVTGSTDEAICDETGTATGTLSAPMEPGTYTATARGQTSGVFASIEITVLGADDERPPSDDDQPPALDVRPVTPPGQLPATGSSSTPVLQMAAISLLAGLGLVAVAYRRRIAPV